MGRTALLINLSLAEADRIREEAENERRSISSYVLHRVMNTVEVEERFFSKNSVMKPLNDAVKARPRTTKLIRCSADEARRIRTAAARRHATISGYVLTSLRRAWTVTRRYRELHP
jgi:uncharacterized protein (DUF1778 family)